MSCSRQREDEIQPINNLRYNQAYEFLDQGEADSAFLAFSQAKDIFIEQRDSLRTANCLIQMSITQYEQGDYFGAQETGIQALTYLDTSDPRHNIYFSSTYNNLGNTSMNLFDYLKAISYFDVAIHYSDNFDYTITYKNNKAMCYQNLTEYDKAIRIFEEILPQATKESMQHARILSNLARTKWLKNRTYDALPEFLQALSIRKKEKDLLGLNASYVHLTDYYQAKDLDSALWYAKKMYEVAERIRNPEDQIYALSKLIELSSESATKGYFETYQLLGDSLQRARAEAKNQFALIRYEVEKNKADNLQLQKDNAENSNRLIRQRVLSGSIAALFIIAAFIGISYHRRRKQRLEYEAQNNIQETKLHLSKKIHDVVANGLYRVMSEIEYTEDIDRDGVLDRLEDMYNRSRDISHEVEQRDLTKISYSEGLANMLKSFAGDDCRVIIAGNDLEQWIDINKQIKQEIQHVLQEWMVNMKKHSQAGQVVIRFERNDNHLKIYYKDNGVGMSKEKGKGKGIANMISRIENLGGSVLFSGGLGEGLGITIDIPLL